ncbi:MAG TPA: TetR/AcrR family transcriptional regulator [Streptosporangiaceae bacterium]|nr:TetR/AcrR family transcriptional regulator [Streptosporangiaceae bacterium]
MPLPGGHGTRRRGQLLESAIFDAVLAGLAESGYDRLTMEDVAVRAGTGKATLYRRWQSKEELVLATLRSKMPPPEDEPDTGSVRGDLIGQLQCMVDTMRTPTGTAMWGILAHQSNTPIVQAVHSTVILPYQQAMLNILRRGAERGEVRPSAVTSLVAEVGPVLIRQHYFAAGPPADAAVQEIVDQVIMPILRP